MQETIVKQEYLGKASLITLIAMLSLTPMLATDLYLPGLPSMSEYFASSSAVLNLTLVAFSSFMAVGVLLLGPLSDKYGRKSILIVSLIIYMIFSSACAFAADVWSLIFFRVFQSLGGGGMLATSTALIKDCFEGKMRNTALGIMQAITVIGPMLAPVVGAFILTFSTWRMNFWVLVLITVPCLVATLFLTETLPARERTEGNLAKILGRLLVVGGHAQRKMSQNGSK